MSEPNYSTWTDEQVLTAWTERFSGAFIDTEGTDDERWRAVANESLERSALMLEAVERKKKWGDPKTGTQQGQLPDTIIIVNPDRLAIV